LQQASALTTFRTEGYKALVISGLNSTKKNSLESYSLLTS